MSPFEEALNQLIELLQEHDSVQAFQAVEKKIKALPELKKVAHDMKGYQQDAVLFQRIEKSKAQKEADQKAQKMGKRVWISFPLSKIIEPKCRMPAIFYNM